MHLLNKFIVVYSCISMNIKDKKLLKTTKVLKITKTVKAIKTKTWKTGVLKEGKIKDIVSNSKNK
ncbi:hypothetical protein ACA081_00585 [Candidatus Hodgkinia cicadicola]